MQTVLDGEAQFGMLLSLLIITATYCLFMYQLERLRDKRKEIGEDTTRIIRILALFKSTGVVLFVDMGLCLTRITFVLFHYHLEWLPTLDAIVIFLFSSAIILSLAIFLISFPWWRRPRSGQGSRHAQKPADEATDKPAAGHDNSSST